MQENAAKTLSITLLATVFGLLLFLHFSTPPKSKGKKKKALPKKGGAAKKYAHIDFTPPKGVQKAAKKGLEWRKKYGKGGLSTKEAGKKGIGSGIARAVSLSKGQDQSPKTIKMMYNFFNRHEAFKKHHDEWPPRASKISWALWGDDAGRRWATKIYKQMEKADDR